MRTQGYQKYRIGELEIDTAQRCLRLRGEAVHPRSRTFDLLVYLLERRHRVVPREELQQALWPGVAVTDNSVMQCVNEARKALGDDSRNPHYIRTISKAGYQFIGNVDDAETVADSAPPDASQLEVDERPLQPPVRPRGLVLGAASAALALAGWWFYPAAPPEPPWFEAAWWKLDEARGSTVADSITRLTGTVPGGAAWTKGVFGSALALTGPEVAVQGVDSRGVLPRGVSPRTLLARVRANGTAADNTVIFQMGDPNLDAGTDHFYLGLHDTGVALFGNQNIVFGKRRIDDGQWHQVAGVFDGGVQGTMRLYVDGAEEAGAAIQGSVKPDGPSHWSIGRRLRGGTAFRGEVDDVRVFARALRGSEMMGLHRCESGASDLQIGSQPYYFSPIFGYQVELTPGETSSQVRHLGRDFGGVTFARPEPGCRLTSVRGASVGQDLRIEAEFRFDPSAGGVTEAGPYFRSRGANPGDGLMGGTSAGFWVQLLSTGQVRVVRLHPQATVAFSAVPAAFEPGAFHTLAVEAMRNSLGVKLDRRPVEFDVGGVHSTVVPLDPKWETAVPKGNNRGSAGIAFGASRNRGAAGGQLVRNIRVDSIAPMSRR